jgi:hypothetical protein
VTENRNNRLTIFAASHRLFSDIFCLVHNMASTGRKDEPYS